MTIRIMQNTPSEVFENETSKILPFQIEIIEEKTFTEISEINQIIFAAKGADY
jgi:hypothetical protein